MSEGEIASKLSSFTLIESLSTISHPPHVLEVRIQERSAIALVIVGGRAFEYDPAGVNLGQAQPNNALPIVLLAEDPKTSQKYKEAISVLLALPVKIFAKVQYIQAQTRDNVKLQLRGYGSQEVIWGDSSQAALKSKVLNILVSKHSRNARLVFDVSSPLAPSVRPR
jgi:cell division protein FtsQ